MLFVIMKESLKFLQRLPLAIQMEFAEGSNVELNHLGSILRIRFLVLSAAVYLVFSLESKAADLAINFGSVLCLAAWLVRLLLLLLLFVFLFLLVEPIHHQSRL